MTLHFGSAWFLLLLLVVPLLWWRWARRRPPAVAFSSLAPLRAMPAGWAVRLRWIVPALRTLVIVLLVVSLARPQKGNERTRVFTEGIAIELVVDRSGSMLAMDFELDGRRVNRLDVVKSVVEDFIDGGDDLPGRPDDLIGLVSFATFADSVCPITLDHRHLVETVRQVEVAPNEEDRATAIGEAIALAVERLQGLDRIKSTTTDVTIKSKVIVLLTDGENNAGDIDPVTAAELAAAYGIKVYTIGAGTRNATAPIPFFDPLTRRQRTRQVPVSIDERTLRAIADATGGQYFRATDSASLARVYAQIDELERTSVEQRRYVDYREMSVESVRLGAARVPPLLVVGLVALALELALASTRFRRIPQPMDIWFENLDALHWLWVVAVVAVVVVVGFRLKRRAVARFADASLMARLAPSRSVARPIVRAILALGALGLVAVSLTDPRWGVTFREVQQRGIDLVVVLDVSRSMLAEDAKPSRLERAKTFVGDFVDQLAGDRVALVTFAGQATVRCPLTVDYGAFMLALDTVQPESAARGGSLLGDALRVAAEAFTDELPDHKAIIVLSDGEDHGSYPLEAAQRLRDELGAPVYTIGLGDTEQGARIPIDADGQRVYLTYRGEEVWTRQDGRILREVALATGGAYVPVGTGTVDIETLYAERIEPVAKREFESTQRQVRTPRFHWFAGLALALLMIESFIGDQRPRARPSQKNPVRPEGDAP